MAKKKNPLVFMDVSIDGDPVERMVFELFYDVAPKTSDNFRALSTGERGISPNTGKSLHYKGSFFHRIIKGSIVKGGDFVNRNGTGGESIYGSNFPDESPRLKHDAPGLLSMAFADRDTLGSHFIITLKADHHLDRKHVVFGKLVEGLQVLKRIEDVGDEEGHPTVTVKIINCGEYNDDGEKVNKSKTRKDRSNDETRKKGKHKRSSKDRRKSRRYHSSESESSSNSDTESSKTSYSDSDLSSSSSDIISSSDERRRKRKRFKKDKYKRGKSRDKRRDKKRRRRRNKRSKRKSKREFGNDSASESNNNSNGESLDTQHKELKQKDRYQKKEDVDEIIPKMKKKKRAEMDLETSSSSEKPKRRPTKKAVLVGLNLPAQMMKKMKSVDVKAKILRMKKYLIEQRGFPEDKIIVIIEDEEDTKPTGTNIREHLYRLVEGSDPGDILFIHLIAYGCSDGYILTPDQKHIEDRYFRSLIFRSVRGGLNLTFVSDCLIQPIPIARCSCPTTTPLPRYRPWEERIKFFTDPKYLEEAKLAIGYYRSVTPTHLSHVDIISLQGEEEDKTKTKTTETTPLPSRVILFTPFPCDHNVSPRNIYNVSEVVFPPPTGYKHTSYGAFTNSILNVIEETPPGGAPVTNLELAQKAMVKLGGQTPPSLSCSHLNHAHAPFLC
ncbi:unnamed protein product [Trifolium pratense]|uniref:Uncharacterized protein n=1 Tax=Trifolium pratense TaxID=57577 RepID=A0ACB0JIC2_TRIPR|nr:unnamed protein product [Trifolium pratense]